MTCILWRHVILDKSHDAIKYMSCVFLVFMCFMTKHMNTQNTCDMCYKRIKTCDMFFEVSCVFRLNIWTLKKHAMWFQHICFDFGPCEHQKNMSHDGILFMCFRKTCKWVENTWWQNMSHKHLKHMSHVSNTCHMAQFDGGVFMSHVLNMLHVLS